MPKVNVTANEDFFDRANQVQRREGDKFVLKGDYAKSLGKQVKIGDPIAVPDKKKEKNDKAGPLRKNERSISGGIEKVKK